MTINKLVETISKPFNERKYILYWCFIVVFAVLGIVDYAYADLINQPQLVKWSGIVMISAFKATIFIILLWLTRNNRLLNALIQIVILLFCILCIVNGVTFSLYGFGIGNHLITIIGQTNTQEVKEFMPGLLCNLVTVVCTPKHLVLFLFVIANIYILFKYVNIEIFACIVNITAVMGMGVLIYCMATLTTGRTSILTYIRAYKSIIYTIREQQNLKTVLANVREFPLSDSLYSEKLADVCLIIGESSSRDHLSVYGYPLNTSPNMLKNKSKLYIFKDAVSSSVSTAQNLERLLSFKTDDDGDQEWYKFPFLIDVFKNAGYKVWWISNQEHTGLWTNSVAAMVNKADVQIFQRESSEEHLIVPVDGGLMPYIDKAFKDESEYKFIGVHLLGSHESYRRRYPKQYNYFNADSILSNVSKPWLTKDKAQTIAEYDNSIRYTDHLLDSIMSMASNAKRPMLMLYLSDHGEDVYDDRDFVGRDEKFVRVPFVIYVNSEYRKAYPQLTALLDQSQNRPFTTADIIHILMTLTGTSYPYYDEMRDVLSNQFIERHRYVDDKPWRYESINSRK